MAEISSKWDARNPATWPEIRAAAEYLGVSDRTIERRREQWRLRWKDVEVSGDVKGSKTRQVYHPGDLARIEAHLRAKRTDVLPAERPPVPTDDTALSVVGSLDLPPVLQQFAAALDAITQGQRAPEKFLTVKDAATYKGVSVSIVERALRAGLLDPAPWRDGRTWRISSRALDRMDSAAWQAVPPAPPRVRRKPPTSDTGVSDVGALAQGL